MDQPSALKSAIVPPRQELFQDPVRDNPVPQSFRSLAPGQLWSFQLRADVTRALAMAAGTTVRFLSLRRGVRFMCWSIMRAATNASKLSVRIIAANGHESGVPMPHS